MRITRARADWVGHDVRLMPSTYLKPVVRRGKTDAVDAEALCEAVTWPTTRFVAIKTPEQQAVLMLHKTRNLLVRPADRALRVARPPCRILHHQQQGAGRCHRADEDAAQCAEMATGASAIGAPHHRLAASRVRERGPEARGSDPDLAPRG